MKKYCKKPIGNFYEKFTYTSNQSESFVVLNRNTQSSEKFLVVLDVGQIQKVEAGVGDWQSLKSCFFLK